jgi:RimJ/RimL family protein N-acetyltransferase
MNVRLRPATPEDLPWIEALAAHPDVEPYLSRDAAAALAPALEDGELLVVEAPPGRAVGAVRAPVVNRRSRIAVVRSLMLDPDARGRGLGAAVVRAVVDRLVGEHGVHRVEAEVYGFNVAALRTFEAAGFEREGVRRRAYDRHGAWQDGVHLGLLADER